MKKLLLLALCALLSANADARTLYVDASRPNNNGNGLSKAKAKKTIQAAVNAAKKGDTIVVYPGKYTPIKTKNKKVAIKSVKGRSQTYIQAAVNEVILADMAVWKKNQKAYYRDDKKWYEESRFSKGGSASSLAGLTLRPTPYKREDGFEQDFYHVAAVAGGCLKNCSVEYCGNAWCDFIAYARSSPGSKLIETRSWPTVYRSKLVNCSLTACRGGFYHEMRKNYSYVLTPESGLGICASTLTRCKIVGNKDDYAIENARNPFLVHDSKFYNCLIAENERMKADNCVFANCTIAKNPNFAMTKSKVQSCIVYKCGKTLFKSAKKNTFTNTFKDDRDPKFVDYAGGEFHLTAKSPCINKGKKVSGTGAVDLDGEKRARGKVDMGCYEYFAAQDVTVKFYLTYHFSYWPNGGQIVHYTDKVYTSPKTYGSLPTPTKANHLFAGWWTDPIAGKQVFASSAVSSYRLYAHWIELSSDSDSSKTKCSVSVYPISIYSEATSNWEYQTVGSFVLTIPSKLDGVPVTEVSIGDDIESKLTSITIPKSVVSISLWGCSNLKTIRLQNGSPLVHDDEYGTYYDFTVPEGCTVVRY